MEGCERCLSEKKKTQAKKNMSRQERGSWTGDRALFSIRFSDISTLLL